MTQAEILGEHLDAQIHNLIEQKKRRVQAIDPDAVILVEEAGRFLTGGKRLRPQFCYWGWRAIADDKNNLSVELADIELDVILKIGLGIELFHAAALIHDDIIDHSDTRRGHPSEHRAFATNHANQGWSGDAAQFGNASAMLLGDLLLAWSDEVFATALSEERIPADRRAITRERLETMKAEVSIGQYLDIQQEHAWITQDLETQKRLAETILLTKSAHYTVQFPLVIGASLAGATVGQIDALSRYGASIGKAFQLRDDVLGVFGDPKRTGKPAGDDLAQGKRTLLVVLTLAALPAQMRNIFEEQLGQGNLDQDQVAALQKVITDSSALKQVESLIKTEYEKGLAALHEVSLAPVGVEQLQELASSAINRDS